MGTLSINSTDRLFATVRQFGTFVTNIEMSGITSMKQVVFRLRDEISDASGLMSLTLRNASQGWSRQASILL
ncbi:MAG: hypothetical protein II671_02740 [Salinivirgaceae bacterium]|nr:hypothetical protein [Salinivirgaceae bacterium]MBQ4291965.1 hypothetical protein [Muribaculaceae bacterium]